MQFLYPDPMNEDFEHCILFDSPETIELLNDLSTVDPDPPRMLEAIDNNI